MPEIKLFFVKVIRPSKTLMTSAKNYFGDVERENFCVWTYHNVGDVGGKMIK